MKTNFRRAAIRSYVFTFGIPLLILTALMWALSDSASQSSLDASPLTEPSASKPSQTTDSMRERILSATQGQPRQELDNFDKRQDGKPEPEWNDRQRQAVEALRKEVPDVQVDFDSLRGTPSHIASTTRFLTSSQPALMRNRLNYEEAIFKVKAYVSSRRALFMHGAEVLDAANVTRKDTTEHSGLQTVVWAQQINGVPVFESVFKANLSGTGEIISLSSTIMPSADSAAADFLAANPNAEATPPVSEEMAILLAAENIGEKIDQTLISRSESPNPKLPLKFYSAPGLGTVFTQKIWLPMGGAGMRLAWEVNVTSLDQGAFAVLLDAVNGDPLVRISRTTAAVTPQYRVWTGDSPTPKSPGFNRASEATTLPPVVPRQLVSVESLNSSASPSGWIPAGQSTTSGNNIAAYADRNGNNLADTGTPVSGTGTESRTFDFPIDLTQDPSTYTAGSVTQLFYWCNRLHDEFYGLGFTETSGSFQNSNFNRNGPTATDSGDQDRVNAEAQDSGGLTATASNRNNANFSTQADGISPRMQVYIATNATPNQDDDLDVQTVIHEYCHGLSNRLVGGGVLISNLQTGGMGEGWGDWYALAMLSKPNDDPHAKYPVFAYTSSLGAANYYWGLRSYPYSTNMSVNPLTFKDIATAQASSHTGVPISPRFPSGRTATSVHAMGEVWCSMLWEARARMVDRYGWAVGNQTMLQLVTDGMKLAPANPNFVQARNAILQADQNNNVGANLHILWNAFAKRGLGFNATSPASNFTAGLVEDFSVPPTNDATPPVVTFSPLVTQQAIFEFTGSGPQAVGGTINEIAAVTFGIVEFNTDSVPNRYWDGSTWTADAGAPGTKLPTAVSGNTWSPAAGVNLPTSANLRNGFYLVNVRAVDNGGNVREEGIVVRRTVNAELTRPLVQITYPTQNSTIDALNLINGTASDPAGGSGLTGAVTLNIVNPAGQYWTGSSWSQTQASVGANVAANGTWQYTTLPGGPNARLGQFIVSAAAFDWAGNVSTPQTGITNVVFTVDPPVDTTRPMVQITSPSPTGTTRAAVTQISGTASDTGGSGLTRYVTLTLYQDGDYWNGNSWTSTQVAVDAVVENGAWVYEQMPTGGNARAGQYSVSAAAHDYAGNVSQPQSGITNLFYSIDASPPTGSITAPLDGGSFPTFPSFSATANDNSGISYVVVYLRRNRDWKYWSGSSWVTHPSLAALDTNPAGGNTYVGNFTLPQVGVNAMGGSYNYIAIPVDAAGNHTQYDAGIVIDYHATFTWTGASPAGNNSWDDPENWSSILSDGIFTPGPEDNVVITNGVTLTSNTSRTISGLQLISGSLNMTGSPEAPAVLTTIGPDSAWTGGTVNGTWNNQGKLAISGTGLKAIGNGRVINNFGNVTWTGPGLLRGDTNATWTNKPGSSFTIIGDGDVFANNGGGNVFNNDGNAKFIKMTGAGGTASGYVDEWTFNNAGEIDCREGTLHFNTALNLNTGTTFAGAGRILLNGTTNLSTEVISTGNPELVATLNGNTANAGLAGTKPLVWSSGTINGRFALSSGSVVDLTTANVKSIGNGAIFTNKGRVNWKGDGRLRGDTNATFNNEEGAVFDAFTDGDIFANNGGGNVFNNKSGAFFRKSGKTTAAGAVSFVDEWTFNNSGTIGADNGVLQFHTAFNLNHGGTITRAGVLEARVLSTNYFVLTGTTTIDNVTFQSSSDWHGNTAAGTADNGTLATLGTGVFEWSGGVAYNVVNISPGSAFLISGGAVKAIGNSGVLKNYANATCTGSGDLRGDTNARLSNYGSFTITSDANFVNNGGGNRFVNIEGGTFRKTGGTEDNRFDWAFDNAGTVTCSSGVVAFNSGGISSGKFVATAPGLVRFSGGQHDLITTAAFEGTGKTQVVGGVVHAVNAVSADATSGLLEIAGGTVTSATAGSFNASGNITWTGGTIGGTFNARAGSYFLLTGGEVRSIGNGSVINNSGTAVFNGPGLLRGDTNATWNNKSGGSFSMTADGDILANNGGGNTFNNEAGATFAKTTGAGGTTSSYIDEWTFNNAGTITSQQGTLHFFTTLNLNNLSSLAGAGRILLNGTTNLNTVLSSTGNPELIGTLNSAPNAGFTGSAPFVWSSGVINGTFILASGSVVDLTSSNPKAIGNGGIFTNQGRVNWRNDGRLRGDTNATFNNESGGLFEAFIDGGIFANNGGGNVFNNKSGAIFRKSGGAAGSASSYVDEWTFNNASTISCLQGTIHFNTTLNLNTGSTFAGNGRVLLNGLTNLNTVLSSSAEQELVSTLNSNTAEAGFTGTKPFVWSSGTINGRFTLLAGSVVDLTTANLKSIGNGAIFSNRGRVNWKDDGRLRGDTNATFNNESGAIFEAFNDGDIFANNGGGNVFNNKTGATFHKSGGGAGIASSYVDEWTFNNASTISCFQGTIHFNTTLNLNTDSVFTGPGRVLLNGVTNLNTVLSSTAEQEFVSTLIGNTAEAGFTGTRPFVWSSGTIHGRFTLAAGSVVDLTTASVKSIANSAVFTNKGRVNWKGEGRLRGDTNATFNNEEGAVFDAFTDGDIFANNGGGNVFNNKAGALFGKSGKSTTAGATSFVDEWAFNNNGTIRADDGVLQFHTAFSLNDGSVITHAGTLNARVLSTNYFVLTGTTTIDNVTFQSTSDWHGNTALGTAGNGTLATLAGGVFEWSGGVAYNVVNIAPGSTFNLTGGTKAIANGGNLRNGGTATWTGGTLRGDTNARFSNLSGGTFIAATDADFTNNGGGNVFSNSGTFSVGAPLGITDMVWSYVQTSSGRLVFDVGGTNATTPLFDQLRISGSAMLGGELNVTKLNGYAPAVGTTFAFLTSAGRTGTFATVNAPGFALDYTAGGAALRAVSTDPLDVWAAAAGLTGADALPMADPDKDGVNNFMEYALGMDPKVASKDGLPEPKVDALHLEISFSRRAPSDLTYYIENPYLSAPGNIVATLLPGASVWTGSATVTETGTGATRRVTVIDPTIVGTVDSDFLRLRVERSP